MTVTCFTKYCREAVETRWMCSVGEDGRIRFALPTFVSGMEIPKLIHPISAVACDVNGVGLVKSARHVIWIGTEILGLSNEAARIVYLAAQSLGKLDIDPRILEVKCGLVQELKRAAPNRLIEEWARRSARNN